MTERDQDILQLIARYGLASVSVLHPLLFAGLTEKAVERVITRLVKTGLLRSLPLFGKQCGYTLTPLAAQALGLDSKRFRRPPGTLALIRSYAILLFCAAGGRRFKKMTAAEFRTRFPQLVAPGICQERYFLDAEARLSLLVGDFGADWRRLVRKARREVQRRRSREGWKLLLDRKLFSVTLLVGTEEKARPLRAALAKEDFPAAVIVVPELTRCFC